MIQVKDLNFIDNDTVMLVKFGGYEAKYVVTPAKVTAMKTWLGETGKPHMAFWQYLKDQSIPEVINRPDNLAEDVETDSNYFVVETDPDGIRVIRPRDGDAIDSE